MNKKLPIIIGAAILLVLVVGFMVWKNSQTPPPAPKPEYQQQESSIQMVDLKTQPKWVQDLEVSAKRGKSANGLENFTLTMAGLDPSVTAVKYSIEYQTTDKGIQGTFSQTPVKTEGKQDLTLRTMDFGTCSTKSCVKHTGATELVIQLDFTTSKGPAIWTGKLPI